MFNVGDIVRICDGSYAYTKIGSYGKVLHLNEKTCTIEFIRILDEQNKVRREAYPCPFNIKHQHLTLLTPSTELPITPVIRKIRQMEKHFLSRKEVSNA